MIQVGSHLAITDNTGGRFGKCIKVYGGNHAKIGDIILISLKKIKSAKKNQKFKVRKGQMYKALILRMSAAIYRKNGDRIQFSDNAILLLDNKGKPLGSRTFGPSLFELRKLRKFKVISMVSHLI